MPASAVALRAAIHDALVADGALTALLGGAKVYDEPPNGAAFPYVTLGEARVEDFSAGSDPAEQHRLTLHAWSRQGGHRTVGRRGRRGRRGAVGFEAPRFTTEAQRTQRAPLAV